MPGRADRFGYDQRAKAGLQGESGIIGRADRFPDLWRGSDKQDGEGGNENA